MGLKVGNVLQLKIGTLARTNTTGKALFTLPAGAVVVGVRVFGANSDAETSATLTLQSRPVSGSSSAATFATVDGKATVNGATAATLLGIAYKRQSEPVTVTALYAEVGTASTVGGNWNVVVEYI